MKYFRKVNLILEIYNYFVFYHRNSQIYFCVSSKFFLKHYLLMPGIEITFMYLRWCISHKNNPFNFKQNVKIEKEST